MIYKNGKPIVTIYTDGSWSPDEKYGGWAAILISLRPTYAIEICGSEKDTTIPRMELTAVIKALEKLTMSCEIRIFSDSMYVVNGSVAAYTWRKQHWKDKKGNTINNADLWKKYIRLINHFGHHVIVRWVKAHSVNQYNNRCDFLAKNARHRLTATGIEVE